MHPGEIDVRVEVAERQRPRRGKDRFSPVKTGISRPRHRSPSVRSTVHEDHVVEQVDRLKAQNQRRVAMLLEDHRRGESGFETMRGAVSDDAAEAAQRLAMLLVVVRQRVQPALDRKRRSQMFDDPPFGGCEGELRRRRRFSAREREPL
jgi:hypothetical protein